jgi:hypothetical protein
MAIVPVKVLPAPPAASEMQIMGMAQGFDGYYRCSNLGEYI